MPASRTSSRSARTVTLPAGPLPKPEAAISPWPLTSTRGADTVTSPPRPSVALVVLMLAPSTVSVCEALTRISPASPAPKVELAIWAPAERSRLSAAMRIDPAWPVLPGAAEASTPLTNAPPGTVKNPSAVSVPTSIATVPPSPAPKVPLTICPPWRRSRLSAVIWMAPAVPVPVVEAWIALVKLPKAELTPPVAEKVPASIAICPPSPLPSVPLTIWAPACRSTRSAVTWIEPASPVLPCSAVVRSPLRMMAPPAARLPRASSVPTSSATIPPLPAP